MSDALTIIDEKVLLGIILCTMVIMTVGTVKGKKKEADSDEPIP